MNCYYHPEVETETSCRQCGKPICSECQDSAYEGNCYSCALDYRNGTKPYPSAEQQVSTSRRNQVTRQVIGWYQIIGGAVGLVFTLLMLFGGIEASSGLWLILLLLAIGAALFATSVTAGILLLRKHPMAMRVSQVAQMAQIPQLMLGGTAYYFVAGAKFTLLIYQMFNTGFRVDFGLYSQFNFQFGASSGFFIVGINIVPIIVLWLLKRIKDDNSNQGGAGVIQT